MILLRQKEFGNRKLRREYEVREGHKTSDRFHDAAKIDVVTSMRLNRNKCQNIPPATEDDIAVRKFRLKRSGYNPPYSFD